MKRELTNNSQSGSGKKPVGFSGRPWKWSSVKKLDLGVATYFERCEERKKPPTISGLANFLDVHKSTLANYRKDELFGSTIEKAFQRVEQWWEEELPVARGTGVQFNLKNNFGWRDKTEQEITGAGGGALVTKIVVDYGDDKDEG